MIKINKKFTAVNSRNLFTDVLIRVKSLISIYQSIKNGNTHDNSTIKPVAASTFLFNKTNLKKIIIKVEEDIADGTISMTAISEIQKAKNKPQIIEKLIGKIEIDFHADILPVFFENRIGLSGESWGSSLDGSSKVSKPERTQVFKGFNSLTVEEFYSIFEERQQSLIKLINNFIFPKLKDFENVLSITGTTVKSPGKIKTKGLLGL